MSILQSWLRAPQAHALGWTLVHFLWEGALVALALAAALAFGRGRAARLRYVVAMVALFAMPVVFAVTFAVLLPGESVVATAQRSFAAGGGLPLSPLPPALPHRAADPMGWLVPFWVAGVLLFHVRGVVGWASAERMRRVGACAAEPLWQQRLDRLRERLRLSKPVLLLESCLTEAPAVVGVFKPVILMPLGLIGNLTQEQVELILIHELAHIRRWDYLVNLLQRSIEGLLFYHPAVWWVSGIVRAERENCCDDVVIGMRSDAREYAVALAALEERRAACQPAVAATGGSLARRIRRLLRQPAAPTQAIPAIPVVLLLVSLAVAAAAWQQPGPPPAAEQKLRAELLVSLGLAGAAWQQPSPPPAAEQTLRAELESPYRRWLSEDVAYIISDEERAAFKRLLTDEERDHFIEQFWLRRDPTPGTVENEFKEEYFRRIAYANDRFSVAVPGWKTDRGRIYILLGPPDKRETHSGGADADYPWDRWLYQYVEGIGSKVIFEFRDTSRDGAYPLSSGPVLPPAGRVPNPALDQIDPQTVEVTPAGVTIQLPAGQFEIFGRVTATNDVDAEVARRLAEIQAKSKIADSEQFHQWIRQQTGMSYEDYRAQLKKDLLRQEVVGVETYNRTSRFIVASRAVMSFAESVQGLTSYQKPFYGLAPGSYVLHIILKNTDTDTVKRGEFPFEVK